MTATQAWYQRDINDIDSPLRSVHDDDDDDERWEAEKFFTQSTYARHALYEDLKVLIILVINVVE